MISDTHVVYRCDRQYNNPTQKQKGGGVLIAINKSIKSSEFTLVKSDLEIVSCIIRAELRILLITVYLPPDEKINRLRDLEIVLKQLFENRKQFDIVLIMGDFNFDLQLTNERSIVNNSMSKFGLKQYVDFPTRLSETRSSLIDHVYCDSKEVKVQALKADKFSNMCDHESINVKLNLRNFKSEKFISRKKLINEEYFEDDLNQSLTNLEFDKLAI